MVYGVKKIYGSKWTEAVDCMILLFDTQEQAIETAIMAYEFELKGAQIYQTLMPHNVIFSREDAEKRLREGKSLKILCTKHVLSVEVFETEILKEGEADAAHL